MAVVGAVALLAVAIGLAAGAFLTTSRTAATGAGASYVPATAPLYVELRLEPGAEQDAALRDLLRHFPAVEGLDPDRPLGDQLAQLLDHWLADDEVDLRWSEDVAPWTDGRLSIAVLELPAAAHDPGADPTMRHEPPMLVMLGVSDAERARASVRRILDEAGAPALRTTEHRGVAIHAADGEPGAYAITDDVLIAAPSADDIVAALDVEAAGPSLASRDDVMPLVGALPSEWLAFGVIDLTSVTSAALEADPSASGAVMARILEHQSLRTAFTVTASADGLHLDSAGTPPSGP